MSAFQLGQNFSGTIARTVVHSNQLNVQRNRKHAIHNRPQRVALIVDGHDHGQFHIADIQERLPPAGGCQRSFPLAHTTVSPTMSCFLLGVQTTNPQSAVTSNKGAGVSTDSGSPSRAREHRFQRFPKLVYILPAPLQASVSQRLRRHFQFPTSQLTSRAVINPVATPRRTMPTTRRYRRRRSVLVRSVELYRYLVASSMPALANVGVFRELCNSVFRRRYIPETKAETSRPG